MNNEVTIDDRSIVQLCLNNGYICLRGEPADSFVHPYHYCNPPKRIDDLQRNFGVKNSHTTGNRSKSPYNPTNLQYKRACFSTLLFFLSIFNRNSIQPYRLIPQIRKRSTACHRAIIKIKYRSHVVPALRRSASGHHHGQ